MFPESAAKAGGQGPSNSGSRLPIRAQRPDHRPSLISHFMTTHHERANNQPE